MSAILTLFPFLEGASRECAAIVHNTILSNMNSQRKHSIIKIALEEEQLSLYYKWTRKLKEHPPLEAIGCLLPEDNIELFKCIEENRIQDIRNLYSHFTNDRAQMITEDWVKLMLDAPEYAEVLFRNAKEELLKLLGQDGLASDEGLNQMERELLSRGKMEYNSEQTAGREYHGDKEKFASTTNAVKIPSFDPKNSKYDSRVETDSLTRPERPFNSPQSASRKTLEPALKQNYEIGDVSPENVYNVLLLGETGVGKTTFINSFANYVRYNSLDEALEKKPIVLMDSSFTISDADLKQKTIEVKATCSHGSKHSGNEHMADSGVSRTQKALVHSVVWNDGGVPRMVRLIDTPGINDTRGDQQDELNFIDILAVIQQIGKLNAICILLKPNQERLSLGFRSAMDNLLIKLHRDASKNILFCFTNTRSYLYRPGDTITALKVYLDDLEKNNGIIIKPDVFNMFCFDNDCFRYLCTIWKLPNAKENKTHKTLSDGWQHNLNECQKLLNRIRGMVAHQVEDTINVNNTRKFLIALAGPLTEIAQNHTVNRRMVKEKIEEIKQLRVKGVELGENLNRKQLLLQKINLNIPQTVCTSEKCTTFEEAGDGQKISIPKICHKQCEVEKIKDDTVGAEDVKKCMVFANPNACSNCKCSYKVHMHMRYKWVAKMEMVIDQEVAYELQRCTTGKEKSEIVLKDLQDKLENIEHEYQLIKESCFEFSAYLKYSSFKQGSDPYFAFINYLIQLEENKANNGGNKLLLLDLKAMSTDYKKGVDHILGEIKANRRSTLTSDELQNKLKNLGKMKLSGEIIAQIAQESRNTQYPT